MGALVSDAAGADDVIVAPATPPGASAIAIVRLSGPAGAALRVARGLAPTLDEKPEPRRALRATFHDATGEPVDTGLVIFFAAPASATGEELIELHAHGSPAIVEALLGAARALGARAAAPGEFTRRALAHGKMDLAQAEGIARLVAAESRGQARRALGLAGGALSQRVATAREALLDHLAALEAGLDFAEDVGLPGPRETTALAARVRAELAELSARGGGEAPAHAPTVVLLGLPNAGKSTLFNALLGSDRAIVSPSAGTTRDAVSETLELGAERIRLVDTAGLRTEGDDVERQGVAVARRAAAGADLVVVVVDLSSEAGRGESTMAAVEEAETLVVGTKADLLEQACVDGTAGTAGVDLVVSARTGSGIPKLREAIRTRLAGIETEGEYLLLARHRDALARAGAALEEAERDAPLGPELAAASLRRALHALGEVTGETATEDLLDRIFSTFCIGK